MPSPSKSKYFKDKAQTAKFLEALKQTPCPYCRIIGTLIKHSLLKGQSTDPDNFTKPIRGQRIYCSNRNCRLGCGRTFSIFPTETIKGFGTYASVLWVFFKSLVENITTAVALRKSKIDVSISTAYRWKTLLIEAQSHIRAALSSLQSPPPCNSPNPLTQTLAHLKYIFQNEPCPIAAFQLKFQQPFI